MLERGREIHYVVKLVFEATNNEIDYEALLVRLVVAKVLGINYVEVHVDSQLVVNQVTRKHLAKGDKLKLYVQWVYE